jgi:hypothetical protein
MLRAGLRSHLAIIRHLTKFGQNLASIKVDEALLLGTNLMNEDMVEPLLSIVADSIEMLLRVWSANYAARNLVFRHCLGQFLILTRQRQFEAGLAADRRVRPDLQCSPARLRLIPRPANGELTKARLALSASLFECLNRRVVRLSGYNALRYPPR